VELSEGAKSGQQVIVPRKGVLELQRILGNEDQVLEVSIGSNHLRVQIGEIRFTSKLIDGRFPEYGRVIPVNPPKTVAAVREDLRQALQRAAILSNEKYRGIRFALKPNLLTIQSHNPEQEEAEEVQAAQPFLPGRRSFMRRSLSPKIIWMAIPVRRVASLILK
jgi:DNA polymerase-3 subunit beta